MGLHSLPFEQGRMATPLDFLRGCALCSQHALDEWHVFLDCQFLAHAWAQFDHLMNNARDCMQILMWRDNCQGVAELICVIQTQILQVYDTLRRSVAAGTSEAAAAPG